MPIDFGSALGLDNLRIQQTRFEIIKDKFSSKSAIDIQNPVRDAVFSITSGHPRLARRTLDILRFQIIRVRTLLRFLASPIYLTRIIGSRALC